METVHRPVKKLSADVARKIAAGEVIDRPCAIVRELMDNAVDSGADKISVEIAGGGIDKIRVCDNGNGMTKEDLKTCAHEHCTSKILQSEDLLNLTTLGFRGEALASIAAVSRLTVSSGTYRMKASITEDHEIEGVPPVQDGKGTIVMSEALFENFPARRVFLKRPASETMLCREVFVEKSLPRPDIAFRLTVDNAVRHDLPPGVSLCERFTRALELKESSSLFSELKAGGTEADGKTKWSFSLVIGEPSVFRNDRKNIFIFVNGRRVSEYSLLQAVEYGCQGFFPNGTHPVCALFLKVDPKTVDFNIHPAKKEVRFKDISSVHHGVSSTVRAWLKSYGIKNSNDTPGDAKTSFSPSLASEALEDMPHSEPFTKRNVTGNIIEQFRAVNFSLPESKAFSQIKERAPCSTESSFSTTHPAMENIALKSSQPLPFQKSAGFIYLGTVFGTFLLALYNSTLYLIDQHAAHERLNFNKIMEGGSEKQNLLVPYELQCESKADDDFVKSIIPSLEGAGFETESKGDGLYFIKSIPARCTLKEKEIQKAILEDKKPPEEIIYHIAATAACRMSVKDGTILGPKEAENLAWEALHLKDPHCPHGRPVWTTLTKEELFARVRRTR